MFLLVLYPIEKPYEVHKDIVHRIAVICDNESGDELRAIGKALSKQIRYIHKVGENTETCLAKHF